MHFDVNSLLDGHILIVDHDPANRSELRAALDGFNQLAFAESGAKALELITINEPDLVIINQYMPELDGKTTCKLMRASGLKRHCPIVFISDLADPVIEVACWDAGGSDYVVRPIFAESFRKRVASHLSTASLIEHSQHQLTVDPLTGAYNRRHFETAMSQHAAYSGRYEVDFSLLVIDVDHFKAYNDTYGHVMGDNCLKAVVQTLKSCIKRPPDVVCRYGGEEFVIILPGTDVTGARKVAANIIQAIQKLAIKHSASPFGVVTVSVGTAGLQELDESAQSLFDLADSRLYQAKSAGRCAVA